MLDLRGLHVYNIFNGTTMVGAVGKILKIMIAGLFQIAILGYDFMERGLKSGQNREKIGIFE